MSTHLRDRSSRVLMPTASPTSTITDDTESKDVIVIDDEIDRYYRTLPLGQTQDLDQLTVAKESSALCAIVPLINNHLKIESILDPG